MEFLSTESLKLVYNFFLIEGIEKLEIGASVKSNIVCSCCLISRFFAVSLVSLL